MKHRWEIAALYQIDAESIAADGTISAGWGRYDTAIPLTPYRVSQVRCSTCRWPYTFAIEAGEHCPGEPDFLPKLQRDPKITRALQRDAVRKLRKQAERNGA